VLVTAAALAAVAPATAVGREIPSDSSGDRPQARAAALFVPVLAGLAVRAAAGPAARLGAGIVGGIVARNAPKIGKPRTLGSIKDARTVTLRKRIFGFVRTRRWLRKKWPDMKGYAKACIGGAAMVEFPMFYNWAAGEISLFDFFSTTELRRSAAGCGAGMAGNYYGKIRMDNKLK
jgi:hypothetical protein